MWVGVVTVRLFIYALIAGCRFSAAVIGPLDLLLAVEKIWFIPKTKEMGEIVNPVTIPSLNGLKGCCDPGGLES